eukprot:479404_1
MSLEKLNHVCDVLRGPFPKEAKIRLTKSYINNYCNIIDIINWLTFLLSKKPITDPNDNNNLIIIPVFLTFDISLRILIIDLFAEYKHKISNDIWNKWYKMIQNHLISHHKNQHNIWKQNDSDNVKEDKKDNDNDIEMIGNDNKNNEIEEKKLNDFVWNKFIFDELIIIIKQINEMDNNTHNYGKIWDLSK